VTDEPHGPLGLNAEPDEDRRWTDAEVGLAIHRAVRDERERCAAIAADAEPTAADYARADRLEASAWDIMSERIAALIRDANP
jgi:hypothetical protein